jgi:hypothetical protein
MTVVILLILSGVVISGLLVAPDSTQLRNMIDDLEILENRVAVYYNKYGDLPTIGGEIQGTDAKLGTSKNKDDGSEYYQIDFSKFEGLTVNYGFGSDDDIYIINKKTHSIYYLQGIEYEGTTYHTLP